MLKILFFIIVIACECNLVGLVLPGILWFYCMFYSYGLSDI